MDKIRDGRTVKLNPKTCDRLKELGKKGETYDHIINKLIDEAKKNDV